MNNYRYVYYIQPGYLHILIEKILKHYKFEILDDEQKEKLHYNLIYNCSNKYYNENRIRYFIKKSFKDVNYKYNVDELIDILLKELINTNLSIGFLSQEEYLNLLKKNYKSKTIYRNHNYNYKIKFTKLINKDCCIDCILSIII